MKKILVLSVIILLGIFVIGIVLKNGKKTLITAKAQKGVSLTPLSFNQKDFPEFFTKAKEAGTLVSWAGSWEDLKNPKSAPFVLLGLSKQYNYTPVIIVSAETKDKSGYISALISLASTYKPKYLGLGNELNYTFRNGPADLNSFAGIFSETYDAVKEKSPNTQVFAVFQYETAGVFEAVQKFPKADIVAFTTYPEISAITNPDNLPADYYSKISNAIKKPVAFTEIGWSSTNQENQAKFISKFFELTREVNRQFVIWPFLYDQKAGWPFSNMGLFDSNGNPRQSWEVWKRQ